MKKRFIITIIFLGSLSFCKAQYVPGKLSVEYNLGTSFVLNKKLNTDYNFPSLFSNYHNNNCRTFRIEYAFDLCSIGVQYRKHSFNNWQYSGFDTYSGTQTKIIEFSPIASYFLSNATSNHELGISLLPKYSKIIIDQVDIPIVVSSPSSDATIVEDNLSPVFINSFGLGLQLRYCYYLTKSFGFSLSVGYSYSRYENLYLVDKSLSALDISAGFKVRFLRNKYFRYE